jgi:hypothetical protein
MNQVGFIIKKFVNGALSHGRKKYSVFITKTYL